LLDGVLAVVYIPPITLQNNIIESIIMQRPLPLKKHLKAAGQLKFMMKTKVT